LLTAFEQRREDAMEKKYWKLAAVVLAVVAATACAPFREYRTVYPEVCD